MRTHPGWFSITLLLLTCSAGFAATDETAGAPAPDSSSDLARTLGITFVPSSRTTMILDRDGKKYLVDAAARTVKEATANALAAASLVQMPAEKLGKCEAIFHRYCVTCHGADGKGKPSIGTPNFADPAVQANLTDQQIVEAIRNGKDNGKMPAWGGKLTSAQIDDLAAYMRVFPSNETTPQQAAASSSSSQLPEQAQQPNVYQAGDDTLFNLPTGRAVDKGQLDLNFTHRFPYEATFTGKDRAGDLFGLDNFALPSFGLRYGVTDQLSVSIWRSPSLIGRPIQLMAAYNFLDEHKGAPINFAFRVSIEGQNNFRKNYTENLEGVFSRSITKRAQIYVVPTMSFNDRRLVQGGFLSNQIPDLPGINAFSIGFGGAIDIRPTVALIAEVIPTLLHREELGLHRPAYSFAIQKKIWRHAFTLGLTNSPGTTVSQRAGTDASFLKQPGADTPSGMFLGFDLTRQIK
jgi:mono/diheme cytochrome c family protein